MSSRADTESGPAADADPVSVPSTSLKTGSKGGSTGAHTYDSQAAEEFWNKQLPYRQTQTYIRGTGESFMKNSNIHTAGYTAPTGARARLHQRAINTFLDGVSNLAKEAPITNKERMKEVSESAAGMTNQDSKLCQVYLMTLATVDGEDQWVKIGVTDTWNDTALSIKETLMKPFRAMELTRGPVD